MRDLLNDLNPWWRGRGVPESDAPLIERACFQELGRHLFASDNRRAAVVLGPRQVGKTTLLLQLISKALGEGFPPENILYADLEEMAFRGAGLRELVRLVKDGARPGHPLFLAVDEAHYGENWWLELKSLVDRRAARMVLTGSASTELLRGMEDSLPGRVIRFPLLGLSFTEFLELREIRGLRLPQREQLLAYLDRGGYPDFADKPNLRQVRKGIRDDISLQTINRDLLNRLGIRDGLGVERMYLHLVLHAGSRLNIDSLSRKIDISPITAKKWLHAMRLASLFDVLPPASADGRQAPGSGRQPKVFPVDPGLVAAHTITGDLGRRAECAAFRHLKEAAEQLAGSQTAPAQPGFGYWSQDDLEMDFLLRHDGQVLAVEVTAETRISDSKLRKFRRAVQKLKPARAILACLERSARVEEHGDLRLEILPLEDLLLACSEPERLFEGVA